MSKQLVRVEFSFDQANAWLDHCLYEMSYGMESGEYEHIENEMKKLGYNRSEYSIIGQDHKNLEHLIEIIS